MSEKEELQIFQLISAAGAAKSSYMEAIKKAKNYEFEEAEKIILQGDECYTAGHHIHAEMIAEEASGVDKYARLILVHAEDQMMSAETVKILAEEVIALYKKLETAEKSK